MADEILDNVMELNEKHQKRPGGGYLYLSRNWYGDWFNFKMLGDLTLSNSTQISGHENYFFPFKRKNIDRQVQVLLKRSFKINHYLASSVPHIEYQLRLLDGVSSTHNQHP